MRAHATWGSARSSRLQLCHVSTGVAAAAAVHYDKCSTGAFLHLSVPRVGVMSTGGGTRKFPKRLADTRGTLCQLIRDAHRKVAGTFRGATPIDMERASEPELAGCND